jgi:hypothetical protein
MRLSAAPVLVSGALLGLGATFVRWRLACRIPDSEACVWGRAYLPVSLVLGAAAGLVVAAVAFLAVRLLQGPGERRDG